MIIHSTSECRIYFVTVTCWPHKINIISYKTDTIKYSKVLKRQTEASFHYRLPSIKINPHEELTYLTHLKCHNHFNVIHFTLTSSELWHSNEMSCKWSCRFVGESSRCGGRFKSRRSIKGDTVCLMGIRISPCKGAEMLSTRLSNWN